MPPTLFAIDELQPHRRAICAGCGASRTASENPPAADGVGKMDHVTIAAASHDQPRAGGLLSRDGEGKAGGGRADRVLVKGTHDDLRAQLPASRRRSATIATDA